jgi:hypothetical protein
MKLELPTQVAMLLGQQKKADRELMEVLRALFEHYAEQIATETGAPIEQTFDGVCGAWLKGFLTLYQDDTGIRLRQSSPDQLDRKDPRLKYLKRQRFIRKMH